MNTYSVEAIVPTFANLSFQHVGANYHDKAHTANSVQDIRNNRRYHRLIAP
jgi:hypothetical protein